MDIEKAYPILFIQPDECSICGNSIKVKKSLVINKRTPKGLTEVKFSVNHPKCDQLSDRMKEVKKELLNLEFELFCKRFSDCKYNNN